MIAIDIGNTNTKIGLINTTNRSIIEKITIPSYDLLSAIPSQCAQLIDKHNNTSPVPVVICSVINLNQHRMNRSIIANSKVSSVSFVHYHKSLGLTINYSNPTKLGADRLANCLYCLHLFPDTFCIIIDIGTAIKIDLLSPTREFLGGFIVPGIHTQLKSLHQSTSALPPLEPDPTHINIPPQSTMQAIMSGVYLGLSGAISNILHHIQQTYHIQNYSIICSGGGWNQLQPFLNFNSIHINDLTLLGASCYSNE